MRCAVVDDAAAVLGSEVAGRQVSGDPSLLAFLDHFPFLIRHFSFVIGSAAGMILASLICIKERCVD